MFSRLASYMAVWLIAGLSLSCVAQNPHDSAAGWAAQARNPIVALREQAVTQLGRCGTESKRYIVEVRDRLGDFSPKVRLAAIQAVALIQASGELGEQELKSAKAVTEILLDEDEHVRYAAEWALARFALRAVVEDFAKDFADQFLEAATTIKTRPHNERHLRVISEAAAHLQESIASRLDTTPSRKLNDSVEPERSLAEVYETSDAVSQLVIIDQLTPKADDSSSLRGVRKRILKTALIGSEPLHIHFALKRWQAAGQMAVRDIFDTLPTTEKLPNWVADVIFELVPRNQQDLVRLQQISQQKTIPTSVRAAALHSLGRDTTDSQLRCKYLLKVVSSVQDQTVLEEAVLQLSGSYTYESYLQFDESLQNELVDVLRELAGRPENYRSTQFEAVVGLARIHHPLALQFTDSFLREADLRDYQLPRLIDAVIAFGRPTLTGERVVLRCLNSQDEFAQQAAFRAISQLEFQPERLLESVLAHVADGQGGTEKRAMTALATFGQEALQKSLKWLTQPCETSACEERALGIITALADIGAEASMATQACQAIVMDDGRPIQLRVAATLALGHIAKVSELDCPQLKQVMFGDENAEVRAALVLTLSKAGVLQLSDINRVKFADEDQVGQVALAVAEHAIDPSRGTDDLIEMLGQEGSDLAENALVDLGSEVASRLSQVVSNGNADGEQRVRAMGVLTRIPAKDYKPLIATLTDDSIGEPCKDCLYGLLDSGDTVLEDMVSVLRTLPESAKGRERLTGLIESYAQGVGSGGEDGEQFATLGKLNESLMYQALDRRRDSVEREAPNSPILMAPFAASNSPMRSVVRTETHNPKIAERGQGTAPRLDQPTARRPVAPYSAVAPQPSAASPEAGNANVFKIVENSSEDAQDVSSSIAFDLPYPDHPVGHASLELPANDNVDELMEEAAEEAAEEAGSAGLSMFLDDLAPESGAEPNPLLMKGEEFLPRDRSSVKVFYGTNRAVAAASEASLAKLLLGSSKQKAIVLCSSIAVIAVCLFGFLRQRSKLYSAFAVVGLCTVTWLGVMNLRLSIGTVESVDNLTYSGQFTRNLSMGVCEVSLPEDHVTGELESKNLFRFEVTNDPQKHVVLKKTVKLEGEEFFDELRQETDLRGSSLLVFIHGYNVSFRDAARRTAQLAYDLEYEGAPVFYSWPSKANWYQYQLDKKNVQLSVGIIKDFLTQLSEKSGVDTINVIAHSMGNVGMTSALAEMEVEGEQPPFNQVVMAAPDLDADIFEERIAPRIVGKARRFTLYTSSGDLALIASRYFNAGRRLGESGDPVLAYSGIEVIDASGVDTSLLGHSYYGSSMSVIRDLGELLKDRPVHYREHLKTASSMGRNYWVLQSPFVALRTSSSPELRLE